MSSIVNKNLQPSTEPKEIIFSLEKNPSDLKSIKVPDNLNEHPAKSEKPRSVYSLTIGTESLKILSNEIERIKKQNLPPPVKTSTLQHNNNHKNISDDLIKQLKSEKAADLLGLEIQTKAWEEKIQSKQRELEKVKAEFEKFERGDFEKIKIEKSEIEKLKNEKEQELKKKIAEMQELIGKIGENYEKKQNVLDKIDFLLKESLGELELIGFELEKLSIYQEDFRKKNDALHNRHVLFTQNAGLKENDFKKNQADLLREERELQVLQEEKKQELDKLVKENESYDEKLGKLTAKITDFELTKEEVLAQRNLEIELLRKQLKKSKKEHDNLKKALELEDLKSKLLLSEKSRVSNTEKLQEEINNLKAESEKASNENEELKKELLSEKANIRLYKNQLSVQEEKNEKTLNETRSRIDALTKEKVSKQAEKSVGELQKEIQKLEELFKKTQEQMISIREEKIVEINKLEENKKKLEAALQKSSQTINDLNQQIENLNKRLEEAKSESVRLQKRVQESSSQIENLENIIRTKEEQIKKAETEFKKLKEENTKEKETAIEKLEGLIKANEKKQKQFDDDKTILKDQMSREVEQSRHKIAQLEGKQSECEKLQKEVDLLNEQLGKLNLENKDLKMDLTNRINSLTKEKILQIKDYEKKMAEYAQEKEKIEKIIKQLEEKKNEAGKLKIENVKFDMALKELRVKYEQLEAKAAKDFEQKNQEIKNLKEQLQDSKKKHEDLQKSLDVENKNLQKKIRELEQLQEKSSVITREASHQSSNVGLNTPLSSNLSKLEMPEAEDIPPPPPLSPEEVWDLEQDNNLIEAFQKRMDITLLFDTEASLIEDKIDGFLEKLSNKELEFILTLFLIESTYYEEYFHKLDQDQKQFVTGILKNVQTFTAEEELISANIGIYQDYWMEGFLTENVAKTVNVLMKRIKNKELIEYKKQPYPKQLPAPQNKKIQSSSNNNSSNQNLFSELDATVKKFGEGAMKLNKVEPNQSKEKKETVYHRALDLMLQKNQQFKNEEFQKDIAAKIEKRRESIHQDESEDEEWL